jgi:hypothetical protein
MPSTTKNTYINPKKSPQPRISAYNLNLLLLFQLLLLQLQLLHPATLFFKQELLQIAATAMPGVLQGVRAGGWERKKSQRAARTQGKGRMA